MLKTTTQNKRIVVKGKKGSYTIPSKLLKQQSVKQEKLYEEYWNVV